MILSIQPAILPSNHRIRYSWSMNPFDSNVSYFAQVDFRNDNRLFGMLQSDRMFGLYILGKTGSGKTNLMECLLLQDINHNRGLCLIDINGDMIKKVASMIPEHRKKDVVYLNTADQNLKWGYNPLRKVAYPFRHLIASHIIETFQKLWGAQSWGIRLEHILRNVILTLLDQERATFSDISRLLSDDVYRMKCQSAIISDQVKAFWKNEFPKYSKGDILPVLNKIGAFLSSPILKKILVENTEQLSIHTIMNEGKIFLVNLSKGMLGLDASHLLGSLLLNSISGAGFHRVNIAETQRRPFFVYLDEFQNYTTLALVNMFSELRKFNVGFIVAHQYLNQLPVKIKESVLGNIGSIVCFRLSYQDAKYLAQEFYPTFKAYDFVSLENYYIYLRMLIKGKPSNPFSAKTIHSDMFHLPISNTP